MESRKEVIKVLFNDACQQVKQLKSKPTDKELLDLYANYKQATIGNINIKKPSFYMLKEVSKWNAWNELIGISKVQAQVNYMKIVESLKSKYN